MKHERGFTLMEVILSISVAAGVALAVFSTFGLIDSIRVRQQGSALAIWEGDLIVHRLAVLTQDGFDVPAPGETSDDIVLAEGRHIIASAGALLIEDGGMTERLSSLGVRIGSVSFGDFGDAEHPNLLTVEFSVSPAASVAGTGPVTLYRTTLYAY